MKIRNMFVGGVIGSVLSIVVLFGVKDFADDLVSYPCDEMEETRLKIILNECSAAVMECTWGTREEEVNEYSE